jgi:hypothetical protein
MQSPSLTAAVGLKIFAVALLILGGVGFALATQEWVAGKGFAGKLILSSIALFGAWRMLHLSRHQRKRPF